MTRFLLVLILLPGALPAQERVRARALGIAPGIYQPGPHNAITDVPGVLVGHATLLQGDSVRTGVTAILPHAGNLFLERVPAAVHVGNGFGKLLGSTLPQFGGFDPNSVANFGFAILSDIEVFFVLAAGQGDTRANILQAPKVTLFNGQFAFVSDTTQRPFVTTVIPVVGDFAAAQQPVIVVLSEGTSLSVQAVVSADRRFVRLTMVPFFSQIGDVQEFTFTGSTTTDSGTTVQDPTDPDKTVSNGATKTVSGTTVQLPTFAITTVSTTVSVPDGGTVLLGGIKRLREGRAERGRGAGIAGWTGWAGFSAIGAAVP